MIQAYGLNVSLGGKCTVDYFAYMFRFYHVHSSEVVPAGTGVDPAFEALWGKPMKLAADPVDVARTSTRTEYPVVYFPGDVRELRDALQAKGTLRRIRLCSADRARPQIHHHFLPAHACLGGMTAAIMNGLIGSWPLCTAQERESQASWQIHSTVRFSIHCLRLAVTRPLYVIMGHPASRQLANLDAAQRDSCAAGRIMVALIAWSVSDVQAEIVS